MECDVGFVIDDRDCYKCECGDEMGQPRLEVKKCPAEPQPACMMECERGFKVNIIVTTPSLGNKLPHDLCCETGRVEEFPLFVQGKELSFFNTCRKIYAELSLGWEIWVDFEEN